MVDLCIVELSKRMKDRRITIELDGEACDGLAERGYDPVYGIRRCVVPAEMGRKQTCSPAYGWPGEGGTNGQFHIRE